MDALNTDDALMQTALDSPEAMGSAERLAFADRMLQDHDFAEEFVLLRRIVKTAPESAALAAAEQESGTDAFAQGVMSQLNAISPAPWEASEPEPAVARSPRSAIMTAALALGSMIVLALTLPQSAAKMVTGLRALCMELFGGVLENGERWVRAFEAESLGWGWASQGLILGIVAGMMVCLALFANVWATREHREP